MILVRAIFAYSLPRVNKGVNKGYAISYAMSCSLFERVIRVIKGYSNCHSEGYGRVINLAEVFCKSNVQAICFSDPLLCLISDPALELAVGASWYPVTEPDVDIYI